MHHLKNVYIILLVKNFWFLVNKNDSFEDKIDLNESLIRYQRNTKEIPFLDSIFDFGANTFIAADLIQF